MKWKREESEKHKAKAKVDMYLVSFCLYDLCLRRSLGSFSFSSFALLLLFIFLLFIFFLFQFSPSPYVDPY